MIQQYTGAINTVDFFLTGGLDASVAQLLNLPADPPKPPAEYMRSRESIDEREA